MRRGRQEINVGIDFCRISHVKPSVMEEKKKIHRRLSGFCEEKLVFLRFIHEQLCSRSRVDEIAFSASSAFQLTIENGPTSHFFSNFKFSLKKKDFFIFHLICSNRLSEEIGGGDGGWQVSVAGSKCGSYSCCKFISALTFYFHWNSWQFKEPEIFTPDDQRCCSGEKS